MNASHETGAGPAAASGPDSPPDILLIEDEANIAEALRFILSREGWRVAHWAEGNGALAQIRALRPRLVVLDLMLPGCSGAEILRELRADPDAALARLPVLLLTARGIARNPPAGVELADLCLAKPFANDALRDTLRGMLG